VRRHDAGAVSHVATTLVRLMSSDLLLCENAAEPEQAAGSRQAPWTQVDAEDRLVPCCAGEELLNHWDLVGRECRIPYPPPLLFFSS
jgi:hypothetical protein